VKLLTFSRWKIHDELWECEVYKSTVRRDQIEGKCDICCKKDLGLLL
jgi:hypothetical protein